MNLKLCKSLKDSEFPQESYWNNEGTVISGGSWYYILLEESCVQKVFADPDEYKKCIERGDTLVKIPTLSELIEEVRKWRPRGRMVGMIFNLEGHWMHDFGFEAKLSMALSLEPLEEKEYKVWSEESPEEAVAKLWLKLNAENKSIVEKKP